MKHKRPTSMTVNISEYLVGVIVNIRKIFNYWIYICLYVPKYIQYIIIQKLSYAPYFNI